jgi:hypothetical protein
MHGGIATPVLRLKQLVLLADGMGVVDEVFVLQVAGSGPSGEEGIYDRVLAGALREPGQKVVLVIGLELFVPAGFYVGISEGAKLARKPSMHSTTAGSALR